MNNRMITTGLFIISFISFAIAIFFIIKFINFIVKKIKKNRYNNKIIDHEIKKGNKKNQKEKTTLYILFIILSISICIFLFPIINGMTSKFPNVYSGNETSPGVITSEIANQIAIYVWPILITYLIILIILIVKKNNYRKIYYPLALVTLTIIIFNLGIIYYGYMILWYLIIIFYPLIALIITLSILGHKIDNNTITKKTSGIILGSALLITLITPLLVLLPNFIENKIEETIYNHDKIEEQQNKIENEIKEEFNDLFINNFISINNLKLSKDYRTINNIELLIATDKVPNNEIDFCNKLVDSYKNIKVLLNKYNYTQQTISFKFTSKNPFVEENSNAYQDSGYIKDTENLYLIYLNPNPIKISK